MESLHGEQPKVELRAGGGGLVPHGSRHCSPKEGNPTPGGPGWDVTVPLPIIPSLQGFLEPPGGAQPHELRGRETQEEWAGQGERRGWGAHGAARLPPSRCGHRCPPPRPPPPAADCWPPSWPPLPAGRKRVGRLPRERARSARAGCARAAAAHRHLVAAPGCAAGSCSHGTRGHPELEGSRKDLRV